MTREDRLREIAELHDADLISDFDEEIDENLLRYLMVETDHEAGAVWLSTHYEVEDAELQQRDEAEEGHWRLEAIYDLDTGVKVSDRPAA